MSKTQELQRESYRIRTPILSIDERESVEDRLTDNALHNILPSRYLLKDEDGNTVEDAEGLFKRVAENVAKAEASEEAEAMWADEFEHMMSTLQVIPNSPTLMNAGAPLQQLSACVAGETPIYTKNGLKRMDEIQEGDMVLTHEGRFKEVTSHWSNGVKDTIEMKRGLRCKNGFDTRLTPDHTVLTEDGEWVDAEDAETIAAPSFPECEAPETISLLQYEESVSKDVVADGGRVKVKNGNDPRTGTFDQRINQPLVEVPNNEDFAYVAGAFLAEGDVDGSAVRFTISKEEDEFKEEIVSRLKQLFDVPIRVSQSNFGEWQTIKMDSVFVADMFRDVFGTGSSKKRIPHFVGGCDDSYKRELLRGLYDGDGTDFGHSKRLTLANPTLVYQATLLHRSIGESVRFQLDANRDLSANDTSMCYVEARNSFDTVAKQESESVEVYDMEVEGDHSFVAGDFVVHNCFVISPDDSMESITQTHKEAAEVFKSGGGMGYSFSQLRPKGALVSSTKGVSSGPLSFMEMFDTLCNTVKQGGKRRGAQMAIMRADHPDIGRFATAKRREGEYSNFNISVAYTDAFIEAWQSGDEYTLFDPQSDYEDAFEVAEETAHFYNAEFEDNPASAFDEGEGALVDSNLWRDFDLPEDFIDRWKGEITLTPGEEMSLPAQFMMDLFVDGAYENGEPGVFYYDETNREHTFDTSEHPEFAIEATNPCAEQPLSNYEACNLGHINLSLMMDEDAVPFGEYNGSVEEYVHENVDMDQLERVARHGTRFLDNVVTQSDFPIPEIEDRVGELRKVGLGIMGFAHMLYQMGIPYGSGQSYEVARQIMRYIDWCATQESHSLAKDRGCFPAWNKSKYANPTEYSEWFEKHTHEDPEDWSEDGYPMRNHNVTTIAPTGTTSMISNTSGGCEPVYNVANYKNVGGDIQGDEMLVEFDNVFLRTLEKNDIDVESVKREAQELMENNEFDGPHDLSIPRELAEIFVTTQDLSSTQHTDMQRAFQEFCDSGISKTINMPNDASRDDIESAYGRALSPHGVGSPIKGMTVYRDGSRDEQVLTTRTENKIDEENDALLELYEAGEISDVAALEMGLIEGEVTIPCPEDDCDGEMHEAPEMGCTMCDECFFSPCAN